MVSLWCHNVVMAGIWGRYAVRGRLGWRYGVMMVAGGVSLGCRWGVGIVVAFLRPAFLPDIFG